MWLGEYKDTCFKEIGLHLQILLHSIMNTIGRTYVSNQEANIQALPITMTKVGEAQFSIRFFCK